MEQIYNDAKNPGGLGGVNRVAKAAGVTKDEARKFLQERRIHREQGKAEKVPEKQNNSDKFTAAVSSGLGGPEQILRRERRIQIPAGGHRLFQSTSQCPTTMNENRDGSSQSADSGLQRTGRTRQITV